MDWKIEKIGEEKYVKVEGYVNHKRSKNYVALITTPHPKYKYSRQFLKFKTIDGEKYLPLSSIIDKGVYEIKFIYYTTGGHANAKLEGFYRAHLTQDTVILEPITEKEVLNIISSPQENLSLLSKVKEQVKRLNKEDLYKLQKFISNLIDQN